MFRLRWRRSKKLTSSNKIRHLYNQNPTPLHSNRDSEKDPVPIRHFYNQNPTELIRSRRKDQNERGATEKRSQQSENFRCSLSSPKRKNASFLKITRSTTKEIEKSTQGETARGEIRKFHLRRIWILQNSKKTLILGESGDGIRVEDRRFLGLRRRH